MRILPFSDESLAEALTVLSRGGVIAHATETCYGLACDLANPVAVERLFSVKERPRTQPVSGLFSSVDDAKAFVAWNATAGKLESNLPGPLTLILPLQPTAKLFPTPDGGTTLGVRVSSHPHAMKLVNAFGKPVTTTSANLHGKPNPYSADDIVAQFSGASAQPDLLLDDGALPQNPPSTVVDCTGGTPEKRRTGDLKV